MQERESYDYIFKYILIGNGNTGKSSLLYNFINSKCFLNKEFRTPQQTVGVEFSSKLIQCGDKKVKLQLWDTAGQERYRAITRTYYRGALGALVLFDITNYDSYNALHQWIKDAREYSKPDIEIIIVGNKTDLIDDRQINQYEASKFCQEHFVSFIETSAITGLNIEEAFQVLTKKILEKIQKGFLDGESLRPKFLNVPGKSTNKLMKDTQQNNNCQC